MFDTAQIKELIERDKHIKKILDLGRQANIAVFTVGTVKMTLYYLDWVILIKR